MCCPDAPRKTMLFNRPAGLQEHEETDELLLMDEEALLMDPEHLPRQLLSDFAVYNSEVGSLSCYKQVCLHSLVRRPHRMAQCLLEHSTVLTFQLGCICKIHEMTMCADIA